MPSEFLENYETIEDYIQKNELPDDPSLIISTRALATDNFFVRYIAKKKEKGCKLIYAQHGGAYGHIKFSWAEDHEIKISDRLNSVSPEFFIKFLKASSFCLSLILILFAMVIFISLFQSN